MLDIKFIRENKDQIEKAIKNKGCDLNLGELLVIYEKKTELIQKIEQLNQRKNQINQEIQKAKDKKKLISEGKKIKDKIAELEPQYKKLSDRYDELMLLVPNIPSRETPICSDDSGNVEVAKWGKIPDFDFMAKDHMELGIDLDIIDTEQGVKTSGFRGYYLKNEAVWLQMAVIMHALHKMQEKGFKPMITPTIMREHALIGSGHFPFAKDEIYQLHNPGKDSNGNSLSEKFYLAGTSEPALLAYFADQTLEQEELPKKICGFSQCYRSEVGSYGKDTRGLYRMHEFMKVEQVVICQANLKEADKYFEEMRGIAEEILKDLKLPYRVLQICTGDMGAGKYKMYDLETWMPSRNAYGETHSDSNLTDWQARRLNIKYKDKEGKSQFAFTLNNTVIASPRILIAILENYQQEDWSVVIPEILRQYIPKRMKTIQPK